MEKNRETKRLNTLTPAHTSTDGDVPHCLTKIIPINYNPLLFLSAIDNTEEQFFPIPWVLLSCLALLLILLFVYFTLLSYLGRYSAIFVNLSSVLIIPMGVLYQASMLTNLSHDSELGILHHEYTVGSTVLWLKYLSVFIVSWIIF